MNAPAEQLISDVERVKDMLGHTPSLTEYHASGGKFTRKRFRTAFGSWGNALARLGETTRKNQFVQPTKLPIEIYNQYPRIQADKAIVAFDVHVPYHDAEFCNEMLAYAKRHNIKTLILGGDIIDFKGLYKKEVQTTKIDWTEEFDEARKFLDKVSIQFDEVHAILGNHDFRIVRLLDGHDRAGRLYNLIFSNPKIKFSKYQFALVNDWLHVSHSGNSKVKLAKAEKIVNVNRKSMLVGHSHRFAYGVHDSGIEVIGEGLCLTRSEYHEYASLLLGDHSKWIQGFWVVCGDKVAPYVKHERIMNLP